MDTPKKGNKEGIIPFVLSILLVITMAYVAAGSDEKINSSMLTILGLSALVFTLANFKNNKTFYGLTTLTIFLGCFTLYIINL